MEKPRLSVLLKPTSSDCNMACRYCYYRYVDDIYPDAPRRRMSLEVFEATCEQYLALKPRETKVGWQGGEPTLMGLDFFREAVEIERRHARPGDCFGNSLQTNGLVLNDEWCSFLRENNFLVGLSIDGPPELNGMRCFPNGKPTHDATMKALTLLKKHGVEFNILVVISVANVDHTRDVWRFLVENDLHYSQFIPCTEPERGSGAAGLSEYSITADQYADFMIDLFDCWIENDDPSYYVRRIDNWLHIFFGMPAECCEYAGDCSNLVTVEWNGDVYPCDFFVEPRYRLGNVMDRTLEQMLREKVFRGFVRAANRPPRVCQGCEWLDACGGGCYRHRAKLGISSEEKPYLCDAKKRIFSHVFGALKELKEKPIRPKLHRFLNRVGEQVSVKG